MTQDGSTSEESARQTPPATPPEGQPGGAGGSGSATDSGAGEQTSDFGFTGRTTSDHRIEPARPETPEGEAAPEATETDPGGEPLPPHLTPAAGDRPDERPVVTVDFAAAPPLDPPVATLLARVHERYAELMASSLSARLSSEVQVTLRTIEPVRRESWWERLEIPNACVLARLAPAPLSTVFEFSPPTLLAIVERLLGGPGKFDAEPRLLTTIESRILDSLARQSAATLASCFPESDTADLVATEPDPRELDFASCGEVVVHVAFEVGFDGGSGPMSLAYRLEELKPLSAGKKKASRSGPADRSDQAKEGAPGTPPASPPLERSMGGARLPLTVELGSTHLTLREVELIRPGDVIPLDRRASEDLEIRIGDETHLRGQPGRVGHRCAVCITGYAEED